MKKKIIATAIVLAMIISIAGCEGKMTLESLLEVSAKNAGKVESFEMEAVLELDVDVEIENMSIGITAGGEAAMEYTEDASHITGEFSYSAATEEEAINIEAYLIKEDDAYVLYSDDGQGWTMAASDEGLGTDVKDIEKALEAIQLGELIGLLADYEDDLELNKELEKVNKKDAYLIEGEVDGNYLIDLLKSVDMKEATDTFDELLGGSDLDLGDIKVDISLWIDKSSKLPVKMTVDFQGAVETAVDAYMKVMTGSLGAFASDETSQYLEGMKIKTNAAVIELTFASFDKVDDIEVPDDVLDEIDNVMD